MADIFVSYARVDKARVAPLVAALEAQGWSVWWDPEIAGGQEFDDLIAVAIDRLAHRLFEAFLGQPVLAAHCRSRYLHRNRTPRAAASHRHISA